VRDGERKVPPKIIYLWLLYHRKVIGVKMIENGFVFAVNKALARERLISEKQNQLCDKVLEICIKHQKTIESLTKKELTKKEYSLVVKYIEKSGYLLKWYPLLAE